ncbi:complex 1 protein [Botrytis cinerea]
MTSSSPSLLLRREVIGIYKELLNLGRSYPLGYTYFRTRLHRAFMSNAHVQSVEEIRRGVERAEFVRKGRFSFFLSFFLSFFFFSFWGAEEERGDWRRERLVKKREEEVMGSF